MEKKLLQIYKNIGETPLAALERVRKDEGISAATSMTYAGRLDPMAEGLLLVLVGDECKNKEKYLGLDKTYEIEVLFGIKTDTLDVLGMVRGIDADINKEIFEKINLDKYMGKFNQEYPMYSSKTIKGKPLHEYARNDEEIEEMPTKDVEIYSIERLGERELFGLEVAEENIVKIMKVKENKPGDFRQKETVEEWTAFAEAFEKIEFRLMKLQVRCSSGTYMRTLAERIGKDLGVPALAYSIKRTAVGNFNLTSRC